jgi:hypothetical protein
MTRSAMAVACVVIGWSTAARAETYLEKVTGVDAVKRTITFTVDKKERTLPVDEKADIQLQVKAGKRLRVTAFKGGLAGIKAGTEATLTTERKDGREVVTKIVLLGPEPKGK